MAVGKRYFNWKLAIVILIATAVLGITAIGLRQWQKTNRAQSVLEIGQKAYQEHDWQQAAMNLGRYLSIESDNVPILLKYAEVQLNIRPLKQNNIQQAIAAYRSVLRVENGNLIAAKRLTEMYLEIGAAGEAELIAKRSVDINPDLHLQRILAVALIGQRKFDEAAGQLKKIINEHPDNVLAYEILGYLITQRPDVSTSFPLHWFDMAIKNNPSSALAYIIRADYYFRVLKDRKSALSNLEQAENLDLSDSAVLLRLANSFNNANILESAEKYLEILYTMAPQNQSLWQCWAQVVLKSGSKEKMIEVAENALKGLSSKPWDFMPVAVELFIRCDRFEQAKRCLSKLRQRDIALAKIAFLEGLIENRKNHPHLAVEKWRRAVELGDKSTRTRITLASALARLGDPQSAIWELRSLTFERPDLFNAHLLLAQLLAQMGDWVQASSHAYKAMKIAPRSSKATSLYLHARMQLLATKGTAKDSPSWQNISKKLALLEQETNQGIEAKLLQVHYGIINKNFTEAGKLLTELKRTYPNQMNIALIETRLLVAKDKTEEAIARLNNTVKKFPASVEAVTYLALLLDWEGKYKESEKVIKKGLTQIKNTASVSKLGSLLAELYVRREQFDDAYNLLDELSQKTPDDIPLKRRLLACQQVMENHEKAQDIINKIKLLEGSNSWQWKYEQARFWLLTGNFESYYPQIISLLQENLLTNPDDQASRVLLAQAYERAGDTQIALSVYQQALDRSPRDLRAIIPMISALYRAKEYDRADKILKYVSRENLYHPKLSRLQLQSHLRHKQLNQASDIMNDILRDNPDDKAVALSLALLKMQQKEFDAATKLLDKLKTQDPNSLSVAVAQVQLSILQGNHEQALKLCDHMVEALKNISAYVLRARTYAALGQTENAIKDFEYITTIAPDNTEALVAKSDFYRSISQNDKAIDDIQLALLLDPNNVRIQKRAVLLLLSSTNNSKVQDGHILLDKALKSNPEDIELGLLKSRLLMVDGTAPAITEAKKILKNITEKQAKSTRAWVMLGKISMNQGFAGKAMDAILRGLARNPNDKDLLLLKARVEAKRSPSLAIPTLASLQELYPQDTDIAVMLADIYVFAERYKKAIDVLTKQLELADSESSRRKCNVALATALYKNNNKEKAKELFDLLHVTYPDEPGILLVYIGVLRDDKQWDQITQKTKDWLEKHPDDIQIAISIAESFMTSEDLATVNTAETVVRMALNKMPDNVSLIQTLAILLQITGQDMESTKLYRRLLEIEPSNVIAINNLAWTMCEKQGKYQQSLGFAQKGLEINPNYIDLIDTRGVVYYRLGEFNKAIQDFSTCIKLYPDNTSASVTSHFHLARALAGLGQKEKAMENLESALNLDGKIGGLSEEYRSEAHILLKRLAHTN